MTPNTERKLQRAINFLNYIVTGLIILVAAVDVVAYTSMYASTPKVPEITRTVAGKYSPIIRLVSDGKTFCSGMVVSKTVIVTAAHCVVIETPAGTFLSTMPIEIRTADNLPISVIAIPYLARSQSDQALLHGDFREFDYRKSITDVNKLNTILDHKKYFVTCGFPYGGNLYCGILKFRSLEDFFWSANGLILPGMSGGPVMLQDGTVIATNDAVEKDYSLISPLYDLDFELNQK